MSVYKVPQDVEAEDTLVGPFTLKQFIFLVIACGAGYMTFVLSTVNPILMILTIPLVLVFGILGIYRRPDQPVEIYLAALLRFYLKPRKRLWDQDGIMEPVNITAPPKAEKSYTDGRSQGQVTSQLKNLANMMDTRGWSTKNSNLQLPNHMNVSMDDRLVGRHELPNMPQPIEVHPGDDILDHQNNYTAQTVNSLAQNSASQARQQAVATMQQPLVSSDGQYQPPQASAPAPAQQPAPTPAPTQPQQPAPQKAAQKTSVSPMTAAPTPDIIRLSQNGDLNVSTIARQADQKEQNLDSDTEISLR